MDHSSSAHDDWPSECFEKYERIEVLGTGSFGMVWMARRKAPKVDEFDDEYVAIKSILIKNEKSKVYAEREIRILQELRHPNVIRLIQAFPVHSDTRVVVLQLAMGPNLHQLVIKRGALGLPLCRLVARQLIAAVGYIHGRGVIHRDVKPSNCILALMNGPTEGESTYDWNEDLAIWSNGPDGAKAVRSAKWKLMLVDFGFARALEKEEIDGQAKKMRNSIAYELASPEQIRADQRERSNGSTEVSAQPAAPYQPYRTINSVIPEGDSGEDDSEELDMAALESMVEKAADRMRKTHFEATNSVEKAIMEDSEEGKPSRERHSGVSMPLPDVPPSVAQPEKPSTTPKDRRISSARHNVRSMSALGTKAYAAPEIRKQLRHKNEADFEKANAAMTECVADYGMIVDAYSVGWTLRVAMTGVPPNFTISEYMHERDAIILDSIDGQDDPVEQRVSSCCCFGPIDVTVVRIRDPSMLPPAATLLITRMTEKNPEDRMTVREAQNNDWITAKGEDKEDAWVMPVGDYPSGHGDPVVPLKCAPELSQLTVTYHMQ